MARHSKVEELLDRKELDALEEFAREPARTIDACHEWMLARGYTISRSAVHRWKAAFDQDDRFRAARDLATELMTTATEGKGTADIADAANLKVGQMLFEQLIRMQTDEKVATKDLLGLSLAIRNVVAAKRGVEQVRKEMQERQTEALAAAEKEAKAGKSSDQVIAKVREILGIE